jgi:hypothetical protein
VPLSSVDTAPTRASAAPTSSNGSYQFPMLPTTVYAEHDDTFVITQDGNLVRMSKVMALGAVGAVPLWGSQRIDYAKKAEQRKCCCCHAHESSKSPLHQRICEWDVTTEVHMIALDLGAGATPSATITPVTTKGILAGLPGRWFQPAVPNAADRAAIIRAHRAGRSVVELVEIWGVSRATIHRIIAAAAAAAATKEGDQWTASSKPLVRGYWCKRWSWNVNRHRL